MIYTNKHQRKTDKDKLYDNLCLSFIKICLIKDQICLFDIDRNSYIVFRVSKNRMLKIFKRNFELVKYLTKIYIFVRFYSRLAERPGFAR